MEISFIVFIEYQGEHIRECLRNICNEFFSDSEVIIINNNCSAENEKDVHEYMNKYKNITLIDVNSKDEENNAINDAIKNSKGKYISFLQDVDCIDVTGMNLLINQAADEEFDIIEGKIISADKINNKYSFINFTKKSYVKRSFIQNKIYSKEFIITNNILFGEKNTEKMINISMKSEICKPKIKRLEVSCCYTYRLMSKYKYIHIINNPNIGIEQLQMHGNTFSELTDFVNGLEDVSEDFKIKWLNVIAKNYLEYLFKEGLNYTNIIENKDYALKLINDVLDNIDLEKIVINKNRSKIIKAIRNNDLDEYQEIKNKNKFKDRLKIDRKRTIRQYIYCMAYRIFSLIPNFQKRALFIVNMYQMSDNFKYIKDEIDEYNGSQKSFNKIKYRTINLRGSIKNKLLYPYYIGRANYIILAEHIPYISYLNKRERTKIIQTWHAAGAFKKFGHSTSYMPGGPNPLTCSKMELHSNYDIATVSSKEVIPYYAEAFRMDESKVIPIGLPRADFFFRKEEQKEVIEKLYSEYPYLEGKKIILYAPTFRGSGKDRKNFNMEFDYNRLAANISDDYIILLKLHPSVKACNINIDESVKHKVYNLSKYNKINELLILTDILIADYSSVVFEYSLLGRPIIFYAYDLNDYAMDRDLYYKYEEFVPGPLVTDMDELIDVVKTDKYDLNKVDKFAEKFFCSKDGNSSKRVLEQIILGKNQS